MSKINITMNDELLSRVDDYVAANFLTRSGFLSMAAHQYLTALEMQGALKSMSNALNSVVDKGSIDDDALKAFEEFERLAHAVSGKK